ncbi:MAG: hypothetical protein E6K70_23375 [Planctomycetota bacterium]|nr:MAG: hypothetical protein E6K70_23375 [Planctomycetota bacterium]
MVAYDDACYGIMHSLGESPFQDLYFQVYSRFSGRTPKWPFGICRASTGNIEPLRIQGLEGKCWPCGWWQEVQRPHWLVAQSDSESGKSSVAVVDVLNHRVVERWAIPGREMPPARLAGPGLWLISSARGTLYRADPERKQLVPVCVNPKPVACRCLAASPLARLGVYTYDCGFAFTLDLKSGKVADHGRVDFDDHRCVFGPAVFAGTDGRYLVANRGDTLPRLGVSDLEANRHWPVGETAIQLVRMLDGTVWGTQGSVPGGDTEFAPARSWNPGWAARPGKLFRYRPGERHVEAMPDMMPVGPLAEAPGRPGSLLIGLHERIFVFDSKARKAVAETKLPAAAAALVTDMASSVAYVVLSDGSLWSCRIGKAEQLTTERLATDFGSGARGCFLLPRTRRLIGIGPDGTVTVFDPGKRTVARVKGPVPLAAGPAVHPAEDVWYFADRRVLEYALPTSRERQKQAGSPARMPLQ